MKANPIQYAWKRSYTANRVIPSHSHEFYEFVYYLDAEGTTEIDNNQYSFKKGSFCLLPPGIKHSEIHNGSSNVIIIGFKMNDIKNLTYFCSEDKPFIIDCVNKILNEMKQKKEFYIDMIYNYVREIVIYILRKLENMPFAKISPIDSAISYIDEYYLTNINFNDLASRSGYCVDRFRILFKDKIGMSPKKYILEKKLQTAKEMILDTNKTFELISFELGFVHYSRFSIFFKEKTGMSPKQYRDLYQK